MLLGPTYKPLATNADYGNGRSQRVGWQCVELENAIESLWQSGAGPGVAGGS